MLIQPSGEESPARQVDSRYLGSIVHICLLFPRSGAPPVETRSRCVCADFAEEPRSVSGLLRSQGEPGDAGEYLQLCFKVAASRAFLLCGV